MISSAYVENIYGIRRELLSRLIMVGKQLAVAVKAVYRCGDSRLR